MTIDNDLALSGLKSSDIKARPLGMPEKQACGVSALAEGYVIPYFDMYGKPLPFYRCKLFDSEIKYKQLKNTSNHIYFPPGFWECLKQSKANGLNHAFLTEGEKKAAAAVKNGFPTVALGGVDSWRNRILLIPKDSEVGAYSYNKKLMGCKLPAGSTEQSGIVDDTVAVGFDDFVSMLFQNNMTLMIVYDSDFGNTTTGVKFEVQRAAAELGFELRRRGLPLSNVRQVILPPIEGADKTGLDDLFTLVDNGVELFNGLVDRTLRMRTAFPRHPNMVGMLNKKLQAAKLNRKEIQKISLGIISDLDAKGSRMISDEERELYYFEQDSRKLLKVDLSMNDKASQTPFAKLIYNRYGLSMLSDVRIIKWLATQYTAEDPIDLVTPYRILSRQSPTSDGIKFQINDGQYVSITADEVTLCDNGADNVLFESDQVDPIDADELFKELDKRKTEQPSMWWEDVLQEVRLKDHGRTATLLSLLYYISPWLHRWRGTQLPAELVIGEAGSGKSTLCELRLQILTGRPNLRNAPADIKDWHASIANTGGLHVTDNVQLLDRNLKQRLSDEICRLITEPSPSIEMRKYYTNADLMKVRVDSVFAFTAITQPFQQSDLLQRSIKVELDKLANDDAAKTGKVKYDSNWKGRQIEKFGGRTAWISHHIDILQRFLKYLETSWDNQYSAKHRLINLEQLLVCMADMFGLESSWIPQHLVSHTDEAVVDADWMFEGILAFCEQVRKSPEKLHTQLGLAEDTERYSCKNIADWCASQEDYAECATLVNTRRLGRYLSHNKAMVIQIAGLFEAGKYANRMTYVVKDVA